MVPIIRIDLIIHTVETFFEICLVKERKFRRNVFVNLSLEFRIDMYFANLYCETTVGTENIKKVYILQVFAFKGFWSVSPINCPVDF